MARPQDVWWNRSKSFWSVSWAATAASKMKVCHIMSGDLWAGAEVPVFYTLKSLNSRVQLTALLLNEGRLADELRKAGVEVVVGDEKKSGFRELKNAVGFELSRLKPDIVHSHRYKENLLVALNFRKTKALVQTIHGLSEPFRGWAHIKMAAYQTGV